MCFSAEADLVAAVVIGGIGIDAVRHIEDRREVALATLPVLFGFHQLTEVFVWLGLEEQLPASVGRVGIWMYLIIAFVVLPVIIPAAVLALDPPPKRWSGLAFVAVGIGVAASLLVAMIRGPIVATIVGHHIEYRVDPWDVGIIVALYVLATCGPLLVSQSQHVRWFGRVNVVAAAFLAWLDQTAFVSLWCVWAAAASAAIAVHLRFGERPVYLAGPPVEPAHR